ncbi:hypothetical protein L2E82_08116 [Cichorium intybus]|uniref:Uncharacterized protein n=1 Tax=Cichorium intybus TaxID=13427 RepID=A0ACB9G5L3_CICIN|nr:hypothetical protein L2E82_08116 [Cichorium intybus]
MITDFRKNFILLIYGYIYSALNVSSTSASASTYASTSASGHVDAYTTSTIDPSPSVIEHVDTTSDPPSPSNDYPQLEFTDDLGIDSHATSAPLFLRDHLAT